MMNIWHLTRTAEGGAGQYALRLSRALREAGQNSSVLVADTSGADSDDVLPLRRIDAPLRRFGARIFRSLSHRIASGAYHTMLGPEHYVSPALIHGSDIVHLHGMTGWIGISGLRKIIPRGARVFQTMHGPWAISGGCVIEAGTSCEQFKEACERCPVLRTPCKKLAKLDLETKRSFISEFKIQPIANSRWMSRLARESAVYGDVEQIAVVPPIVDDRYFLTRGTDFRRELCKSNDKHVVSLGARSITDPHKGISEFLKRLSMKSDLADRTTVLLFGEGSITIPENLDVRLAGSIADPVRLAHLYQASDVFVSPSAIESFGMACLEAQASGIPVVGFDVGGIRDAIWPSNLDYLVPFGHWSRLLNKIEEVCHDKARRENNRKKISQWISQSFMPAVIAKKQIQCYQ